MHTSVEKLGKKKQRETCPIWVVHCFTIDDSQQWTRGIVNHRNSVVSETVASWCRRKRDTDWRTGRRWRHRRHRRPRFCTVDWQICKRQTTHWKDKMAISQQAHGLFNLVHDNSDPVSSLLYGASGAKVIEETKGQNEWHYDLDRHMIIIIIIITTNTLAAWSPTCRIYTA